MIIPEFPTGVTQVYLFNDALSSSAILRQTVRRLVNNKYERDKRGSGCGLIWGIILTFVWNEDPPQHTHTHTKFVPIAEISLPPEYEADVPNARTRCWAFLSQIHVQKPLRQVKENCIAEQPSLGCLVEREKDQRNVFNVF
jgi:hypothetical protein